MSLCSVLNAVQLQVADDAMAQLVAMGFTVQEARRGLRMAGGDLTAAAEFVLQQRDRQRREREDARKRRLEKRLVFHASG